MAETARSCFRCGKVDDWPGNFLLTCCKCKRTWHHRCHIPLVEDVTLIEMIRATNRKEVDKGLSSWMCKRCLKAHGKPASITPAATKPSSPANIVRTSAPVSGHPSMPVPTQYAPVVSKPGPSTSHPPRAQKQAKLVELYEPPSLKRPSPAPALDSIPPPKRRFNPNSEAPRVQPSDFPRPLTSTQPSQLLPVTPTFRPYSRPAHFQEVSANGDVVSLPHIPISTRAHQPMAPDAQDDSMDVDTPSPPQLPRNSQDNAIPDIRSIFSRMRASGKLDLPEQDKMMFGLVPLSKQVRPPPPQPVPIRMDNENPPEDDEDDLYMTPPPRLAAPLDRALAGQDDEGDLYLTPPPPRVVPGRMSVRMTAITPARPKPLKPTGLPKQWLAVENKDARRCTPTRATNGPAGLRNKAGARNVSRVAKREPVEFFVHRWTADRGQDGNA